MTNFENNNINSCECTLSTCLIITKTTIRVDIHRLKGDEILGENKRTYEKNNYTTLIGRIIFNLICDWLIPISSDTLIGPRSHSCVISAYRFKWWNLSVYNQTTVKVIFTDTSVTSFWTQTIHTHHKFLHWVNQIKRLILLCGEKV